MFISVPSLLKALALAPARAFAPASLALAPALRPRLMQIRFQRAGVISGGLAPM